MSELFPGLPEMPPPAPPKRATAVILWRDGPRGRECFWVRRGEPLRFAGGFYAFPGGKIDEEDWKIPVEKAGTPLEAAQVVAATRELFEETGVLYALGAERIAKEVRDEARRELLAGRRAFAQILEAHALHLHAEMHAFVGRWITPSFVPYRFDAQFMVVKMPPGQEAEVWPGELSDGAWIRCADAVEKWERGEALLHPPNRWAMQCLAREAPPQAYPALANAPHLEHFVTRVIDFQKGLYLVPQRTPTLPPATHTNCYLVEIEGGLAIVDPGSGDDSELAWLDRVLADIGRPPKEIWLTHHHADHQGGVAALASRGLTVRAHPLTATRLAEGVRAEPIEDGALLPGGWRVLHTPGHAKGHLCFHHEKSGALLCGDMVSTLSTIVIDPPEGDMAEYLRQLERLRALGPRTLYPAHGAPAPNARGKLDEYLAHRKEREAKVLLAAKAGGTLDEITTRAYDDTPPFIHPVAARSCLASLEKLEREGKVSRRGEWFVARESN
jgi:glyoxylase-like metal-dependent hydrolase (beta-lactamase superfamily II)/8-oxo-dGTP pyrophosphatase MutT (NUDIX family)